ncbi:hypothetical protein BGZ73_007275 [Actinomortierella ambigua]|nr:hypothetical protein BGZ73_007275 [Actinomortierella ambigua]
MSKDVEDEANLPVYTGAQPVSRRKRKGRKNRKKSKAQPSKPSSAAVARSHNSTSAATRQAAIRARGREAIKSAPTNHTKESTAVRDPKWSQSRSRPSSPDTSTDAIVGVLAASQGTEEASLPTGFYKEFVDLPHIMIRQPLQLEGLEELETLEEMEEMEEEIDTMDLDSEVSAAVMSDIDEDEDKENIPPPGTTFDPPIYAFGSAIPMSSLFTFSPPISSSCAIKCNGNMIPAKAMEDVDSYDEDKENVPPAPTFSMLSATFPPMSPRPSLTHRAIALLHDRPSTGNTPLRDITSRFSEVTMSLAQSMSQAQHP